MPLREELHRRRDMLRRIAARHGAWILGSSPRMDLRLFGSVARGEERPDSDTDLLIDLAEDRGFGDCLALAEELETLLHRKVDLVLARGLTPRHLSLVHA
jgi:predicted nucleotidyltransferase